MRTFRSRNDFLNRKKTKPGFLAEIRASAFVSARDGWLRPFVVPPGRSLFPDATKTRELDGQSTHHEKRIAVRIRPSPRRAAGPGRWPWRTMAVCRPWPDSVV